MKGLSLLLLLAVVVSTFSGAEAVSASGLLTSSFSISQLISPSLYVSPTTFTGSGAEPYHYLTTEEFFTPQGGMTTQDRFTPSVQSDDRDNTHDNEIYWVVMASTVAGAVFLTFLILIGVYCCVKIRNSRRQYSVHQTAEDEMEDMSALEGEREYDDV